ncbi:MAG: serine hydrolase domain-containing protein, partial [Bacteroidota bacterium]
MKKVLLFLCMITASFLVNGSIGLYAGVEYQKVDAPTAEALQSQLDYFVKKYEFIGVSASVIIKDKGIWTGTSGYANINTGLELKPDMLYCYGSITKTFISAMFLQFVDEGKLSLNDTLGKWIQGYSNIRGDVTIWQLLGNTSGLYSYWSDTLYFPSILSDKEKVWTNDEVLRTFVHEPSHNPGEAYEVSNTNYILLGMIAEKVTNNSLGLELKKRFFTKCNLNTTFFADSTLLKDNAFTGTLPLYKMPELYLDTNQDITPDILWSGIKDYSSLLTSNGANYAILSTTEDIAKWADKLYS